MKGDHCTDVCAKAQRMHTAFFKSRSIRISSKVPSYAKGYNMST
jgi:hypothetical protein